MKLVKLKLENFLTYEELDYDFEDKALLIQGVNLTDKNQKSNGSGKSAIQTAIEFALTASNSRGVNDAELVTYGFEESKVKLFIRCESRKETLEIEWIIKVKSSNKLSLKLNDKEISFSNVNDGKKQILNWLGISKEDLFNYFIINSTRFKSFFGSSNREKVDLINRFSDSSIIDGLENIDNSQFDGEKLDLEYKINRAEGGIETIKEQIIEANKVDFEKKFHEEEVVIEDKIEYFKYKILDKLKLIKGLKAIPKRNTTYIKDENIKIEKIKLSIQEIDNNIASQDVVIKGLKSNYEKEVENNNNFKTEDFSIVRNKFLKIEEGVETNIQDLYESKESIEDNILKIEKFLNGVGVKLSGAITCPSCSHIFILDGDREVLLTKESQGQDLLKKYKDSKATKEVEMEDLRVSLKAVKDSISQINNEEQQSISSSRVREEALGDTRRTLNDSIDVLSSLKRKSLKSHEKVSIIKDTIRDFNDEIKDIKSDEKNVLNEIKVLEDKISNLRIDIKSLKVSDNKEAIKKLNSSVKEREDEIIKLNKKLIAVNDIIYDRNKWSNNFKQFRLHLANKSLETMQYRTNHFLKELGNDILVRLDGYKVKANGTIKEEISAVIIRDGERTFSSLSGGEQVRVLFSSILANRYLINSTHPHGGLDFLGVDEIFDKIDSLGMKHLIMSAKKLETCIMIISHVSDEELSGEDVLTIVKENGVSKIKL
tara:strand:+ start:4036 stop:6174 length:2139 start_codon:yes stop_codon:yes gene_type:complete